MHWLNSITGLIRLKVTESFQHTDHRVVPPFKWNHSDRWHPTYRKRFFFSTTPKICREGGDWWHTYLVPASITVVMFPLSIKCIWFPAEGGAGRAEIWQQHRGQEGSSCKHHFHWCAWKWTKSGNAYTIRAGTLSDLIFERGLSRSPLRVLLIHCPGQRRADSGGLYNSGWQSDSLRGARQLLCSDYVNEFSHQSQENYLKSWGQRDKHFHKVIVVGWFWRDVLIVTD